MKRHALACYDNMDVDVAGGGPWVGVGFVSKILLAIGLLFLLSGCGGHKVDSSLQSSALFAPSPPPSIPPAYTPTFYVTDASKEYNCIGEPTVVTGADGKPEIIVSPDNPVVYYTSNEFSTENGDYHNLVYRIHFSEVPFGWSQFNLTAGKNPGLLFIYTFDAEDRLLLVTTLHSCGCYLAFLPTAALPNSAYPPDWPAQQQQIYGQTLPARLPISGENPSDQVVFKLENETHRVADVFPLAELADSAQTIIPAEIRPVTELYLLPFAGEYVSFFETSGSRAGYVKNNTKWLEKIFIGWWAFDFRVGEDKAYGGPDNSDIALYTSLKFWAREESDLKDFAKFLAYWRWKL